MTRRRLSLGLIGAGRWGRNYIHTIGRLDNVDLAWIADPDPAVADAFAARCPVYMDWQTALSAGGVEGVIVATPPHSHAEIAGAATAAGLGVLIEKPLTTSPEQARELLAHAEWRSSPVWVDHVHLFSPGYRRLKELVEPERPIRQIIGRGGHWGPFRDDVSVLWDWGPHDVAFCLDLAGETPVAITANRRERRETQEGTGDILDIGLEFPGGTRATITIGNIMAEKSRRLEVTCAAATLILDDTAEDRLIRRSAGDGDVPLPIPGADEPPLVCAINAFADAIRSHSTDLAPLRQGVSVVEVLAACERLLSEDRQGPSHPRP